MQFWLFSITPFDKNITSSVVLTQHIWNRNYVLHVVEYMPSFNLQSLETKQYSWYCITKLLIIERKLFESSAWRLENPEIKEKSSRYCFILVMLKATSIKCQLSQTQRYVTIFLNFKFGFVKHPILLAPSNNCLFPTVCSYQSESK